MRIKNIVAAIASIATLGLGASLAFAEGEGPCKLQTKLTGSPTAEACKRGGQKEATKEMKKMVKTAKAKGVKFVCDDCHKNTDDYALTPSAEKDYEKLLAAQK